MSEYKLYYYAGSRHSAAALELMERSGLEYEAKCYGDDRRELEGLWRDLRIGELPVLIHKDVRYTGLELIREHIALISKKAMQKACGGKCRDCHFWRTELYGWGKHPEDGRSVAVCTARDSPDYNQGVLSSHQACPAFYDQHINLNFLQREGVEQGFSPGKSPVEGYFANHPEESWEDAFPPEYRAARRNHE